MTIRIIGDQAKQRLDFAARNVYTFTNDEYRVLPSSAEKHSFILEVNTIRHIDPIVRIAISDDGLTASVSLYPGVNSNRILAYQEIIAQLVEQHKVILACINEDVVKDAAEKLENGYILENIQVAHGKEPVEGKDAVLDFLFEKPSRKPKLLPNGKVDYREFNKFVLVEKDSIIIKRTAPVKGKDGRDIMGGVIKAREGIDKTVTIVEGVYSNSDKTEFRAKYNGHIILSDNSISVLPLIQINGDVDMKIGNIRFEGTVHVTENVRSGFIIDADDIIVEGIVENADLKARGNIVVKRGIKGVAERGSLRAGGNISVGYCENANIIAGGELTIEKYCFNSTLQAHSIKAVGKEAIISGGTIEVFSHITATKLGSKNSGRMIVSLGYSPLLQSKADKVRVEVQQLHDAINKMTLALSKVNMQDPKVLMNPKVKMLLDSVEAFKRRLPLLEKKYNDLVSKSVFQDPKVYIEEMIYPGVELKLLGLTKRITHDMTSIEFYVNRENHDIDVRPYTKQSEE